jgi:hypothetical protein
MYTKRQIIGRSKNYEWKPITARLAGRLTVRWENDIQEDLKIMTNNWTKCIQNWAIWMEVADEAKTFKQ